MRIYFCVTTNGEFEIKSGVGIENGGEGLSEAIIWFVKLFPGLGVHRMLVVDPTAEMDQKYCDITKVPLDMLIDFDYRLPVKELLISMKTHTPYSPPVITDTREDEI